MKKYLKNFIYLLIISVCLYAQDQHVYWEFNTEYVEDYEAYTDDHIVAWVAEAQEAEAEHREQ